MTRNFLKFVFILFSLVVANLASSCSKDDESEVVSDKEKIELENDSTSFMKSSFILSENQFISSVVNHGWKEIKAQKINSDGTLEAPVDYKELIGYLSINMFVGDNIVKYYYDTPVLPSEEKIEMFNYDYNPSNSSIYFGGKRRIQIVDLSENSMQVIIDRSWTDNTNTDVASYWLYTLIRVPSEEVNEWERRCSLN